MTEVIRMIADMIILVTEGDNAKPFVMSGDITQREAGIEHHEFQETLNLEGEQRFQILAELRRIRASPLRDFEKKAFDKLNKVNIQVWHHWLFKHNHNDLPASSFTGLRLIKLFSSVARQIAAGIFVEKIAFDITIAEEEEVRRSNLKSMRELYISKMGRLFSRNEDSAMIIFSSMGGAGIRGGSPLLDTFELTLEKFLFDNKSGGIQMLKSEYKRFIAEWMRVQQLPKDNCFAQDDKPSKLLPLPKPSANTPEQEFKDELKKRGSSAGISDGICPDDDTQPPKPVIPIPDPTNDPNNPPTTDPRLTHSTNVDHAYTHALISIQELRRRHDQLCVRLERAESTALFVEAGDVEVDPGIFKLIGRLRFILTTKLSPIIFFDPAGRPLQKLCPAQPYRLDENFTDELFLMAIAYDKLDAELIRRSTELRKRITRINEAQLVSKVSKIRLQTSERILEQLVSYQSTMTQSTIIEEDLANIRRKQPLPDVPVREREHPPDPPTANESSILQGVQNIIEQVNISTANKTITREEAVRSRLEMDKLSDQAQRLRDGSTKNTIFRIITNDYVVAMLSAYAIYSKDGYSLILKLTGFVSTAVIAGFLDLVSVGITGNLIAFAAPIVGIAYILSTMITVSGNPFQSSIKRQSVLRRMASFYVDAAVPVPVQIARINSLKSLELKFETIAVAAPVVIGGVIERFLSYKPDFVSMSALIRSVNASTNAIKDLDAPEGSIETADHAAARNIAINYGFLAATSVALLLNKEFAFVYFTGLERKMLSEDLNAQYTSFVSATKLNSTQITERLDDVWKSNFWLDQRVRTDPAELITATSDFSLSQAEQLLQVIADATKKVVATIPGFINNISTIAAVALGAFVLVQLLRFGINLSE